MVELLRIETKLGGEKDSKQLASSAADQYRNFLKSRAVFAPPGDLGQKGGSGPPHSFRVRRLSDARIDERVETGEDAGKVRRSHSSGNILDEVDRCGQSVSDSEASASSKRSKIEYFKQFFSKKLDKPKKHLPTSPIHSTFTLIRDPPETYPHFPSDVSTSDYASDNELDEVIHSNSPHYKISTSRSPIQLDRNSKIASIVKRFETPSKPNPIASTQSDGTESKALAGIQAITSDLSSLVSDINSLSVNLNPPTNGESRTDPEVLTNNSEDEFHDAMDSVPRIDSESILNSNMDEVNSTLGEMRKEFGDSPKDENKTKTLLKEGLISTHTRPPYFDLNAKRLSIDQTINRILEHPSPKNKVRSYAGINPPSLLPRENPFVELNLSKKFVETKDNLSNTSPLKTYHMHSRSLGDMTEVQTHKFESPPELVVTPPSPSTPLSFDLTPGESDVNDNFSVQSMPISSHRHRYTGYSLPPDQSRSVSDRIRSLLSGKPIDHPKVDKLTVMRAAIERRRSESKPTSVSERSVLVEVKQPENLSVRSLLDRFERKMKQEAPESVLTSPAHRAPTARRMSEDLIVKPTFAGDTKLFTKQDILSMRSEYNTDEDANKNKSLFQPKYTIK